MVSRNLIVGVIVVFCFIGCGRNENLQEHPLGKIAPKGARHQGEKSLSWEGISVHGQTPREVVTSEPERANEPGFKFSGAAIQIESHQYESGWWGWGGWGRAVTAWGDHLRFIGWARYLSAKAHYETAIAAQAWAQVAVYWRLMRSMHQDLVRLENEKGKWQRTRDVISERAWSLNAISLGKVRGTPAAALGFFAGMAGFSELPIVKSGNQVGPFGPEQFIAPPFQTRFIDGVWIQVPVVLEGFDGGTVDEFLAWMRVHPYDVVVESSVERPTAWQVLRELSHEIKNQVILTDRALAEEMKLQTSEWIKIWGETALWSGYGDGILRDYRQEIAAARRLRR